MCQRCRSHCCSKSLKQYPYNFQCGVRYVGPIWICALKLRVVYISLRSLYRMQYIRLLLFYSVIFQSVISSPSFPSPANSTPATSSVIFQSCKFQSCKFSYPVRTMFDKLLTNCRARLEVNSWLVGASSMASMWRVSSQMNRNEYQYVTLVTGDWMSPLSATTVHIT